MRTKSVPAAMLLATVAGMAASQAAMAQTVFYSENFDSAVLNQLSGDPRVVGACGSTAPSFTHVPPAGWTVNNCGVPSYACRVGTPTCPPQNCGGCGNNEGVLEWEGWSFARKEFWFARFDNDIQNRDQFTLASGNVAVADPDEWDDRGNPDGNCGFYNTFMSSPAVNITSAAPGTLAFVFDSSWRPEGFDDADGTNNQTAIIRVYYTVGGVEQPAIEVLRWDSDNRNGPGPFFKADATNETVTLDESTLQVLPGATAARFEFGLVNAANDWWWAVDNLRMTGSVNGSPTTLFSEDFDSVTLLEPVHELPTGCGVTYCGEFTHTHDGPNGVTVTLSNPPTGGVPDFRGWSFMTRSFWSCAANNNPNGGPTQNGGGFLNSSGLVAVIDGDEFRDVTIGAEILDSTLSTPAINIAGRTNDIVVLSFDSSWRWEAPQAAYVTATFNDANATTIEVLNWQSDTNSLNFKADAVNERVALPIPVPAGATTVSFGYRYVGGNNWWWAVDNVTVFEGEAVVSVASINASTTVMSLAPDVNYAACNNPWSPTPPTGWTEIWDPCGACPSECGRPEWRGWSFASKDWWYQQVDNQERDQFTRASGYVAIADPDEWDDFTTGSAEFNAFMTTPSIPLAGNITSASLSFDSTWRAEGLDDTQSCRPGEGQTNNQTAIVKAIYTVGGNTQTVEVLHWDSDPNGVFFKPDNTNEAVSLDLATLAIPAGATAVKFEFSMTKARNDWWWAIDNVDLKINGSSNFSENFENVPDLQPAPTESAPVAQCFYYSTIASQGNGLTADNTGVTNCVGQTDFSGWTAWLTNAWARVGGGDRLEFTPATAFVSDFNASGCDGTAIFATSAYSIGSLNAGTVELSFNSSWGSEAGHVSSVEVSYDNGPWTSVLSWNPGNKPTTGDETVTVGLNNPEGASSLRVRFVDQDSGWWAIANVAITGVVGQPSCPADYNGDGFVDFFDFDDFVLCFEGGACPPGKSADFNNDGFADFFDFDDFVLAFESGC